MWVKLLGDSRRLRQNWGAHWGTLRLATRGCGTFGGDEKGELAHLVVWGQDPYYGKRILVSDMVYHGLLQFLGMYW